MENIGVFKAIAAVSGELAKEGIAKSRNNQQQGFKFRGIDDVLNALAPILVKHGLVVVPRVMDRTVVERQTKSGGALFYVTLMVSYTLTSAEDGSFTEAVVCGEAMDSGDKATNKAMSAAYKYFAIQTFAIPTEGDNDADATTHDVAPSRAQAAPKAAPAGSLEDRAKGMSVPRGADNPIPDDARSVLDAMVSMEQVTEKCGYFKPRAKKEGWDRALARYWQEKNEANKALVREVFGE